VKIVHPRVPVVNLEIYIILFFRSEIKQKSTRNVPETKQKCIGNRTKIQLKLSRDSKLGINQTEIKQKSSRNVLETKRKCIGKRKNLFKIKQGLKLSRNQAETKQK
jgi:hypothetical protein